MIGAISATDFTENLQENEFLLEITNSSLMDSYHQGAQLFFEPYSQKVFVNRSQPNDSEKVVLYEAIAYLHEEIQKLKGGGV